MSMYSESVRAFLKPVIGFIDDESVTEIMINGPTDIWIEKGGKVTKTDAQFTEDGLLAAARNIAQYVGRVMSDERPRVDARLPDGSRIHIVLPPIARRGTTIAIRKFFKDKLSIDRLISFGACTPPMARLIDAVVKLKLNAIVAGGTGSGKTTLLNVVSQFIPLDERILTIEDSAELQMQQPHLVSFESRPPDKFGKGEVTLGDLLNSALRLRPDRIVVGEVRGGEAFYLLQAMNTGHGGSLATTHANTPVDTLRRLESLCLMSGVELPMVAVRAQVASAVNVIICCERESDGSRKITHISEVLPLNDKGDYRTQDLWVYTITGKQPDGKILGYHAPTGILPTFLPRLKAQGFGDLDESFFDPARWKLDVPPVFTADEAHRTRWAPSLRHREGAGAVAPPAPLVEAPKPVAAPPVAPPPTPIALKPVPPPPPPPPVEEVKHEPPAVFPVMPSLPFVLAPGTLGSTLTETPLPKAIEGLTPPAVALGATRRGDPPPADLPTTPLTDDTPRSGIEAPFQDGAVREVNPDDTDPGSKTLEELTSDSIEDITNAGADALLDEEARKEAAAEAEIAALAAKEKSDTDAKAKSEAEAKTKADAEKKKPEPVKAVTTPPRPVSAPPRPVDEPTIQVSEDLLQEVERAVGNDTTHVKRNPLLATAKPADPPAVRRGNPGARKTIVPTKKGRDQDEKTDPHIRIPNK